MGGGNPLQNEALLPLRRRFAPDLDAQADHFLRIGGRIGIAERSALFGQIAAVSVGIYNGTPVLDLDYAEDSSCECDMNVVMNDAGQFIEVQGTAEGHAFRRDELDSLLDLASGGIKELIEAQRQALAG